MAFNYLPIINGNRQDPLAHLARGVLWLGSQAYRTAVTRRNARFDSGKTASFEVEVPVISVGNLTTGGTGKTPIVCYLAKYLRSLGLRVAIVSRGYGRGESDSNDEALELYDRLPDVPHLQDPDRVASAKIAIDELGAEVILMDDGFQHRFLRRDLDLVAIDATQPFGFGHCLPRGLLREPLGSLSRADLVLLTRCDQVDGEDLNRIRQTVLEKVSGAVIVETRHSPCTLFEYPSETSSIDDLRGAKVAAVSAIGNPEAFESTLRSAGAVVVEARRLADHDPYSPETVETLRQWIRELPSDVNQVICTHKDLVKLQTDRLGGLPVRALQIELSVDSGESMMLQKIRQVCIGNVDS